MKELFDFIQDSYDPKYSSETANESADVQTNTQQADVIVDAPVSSEQITTNVTTQIPYDKSMRKAETKAGTTTEAEDKSVPLYEINNKLLLDLGGEAINQDIQYSTKLFESAKQNPVVNGKPIDLSSLPEVMKDPNSRKQIMEQATKLFESPDLSVDDKWQAQMNSYYAVGINKAIPLIQKKIHEQMYQSAMAVDASLKARNKSPQGTDLKVKKTPGYWGKDDPKYDVKATELFTKNNDFLSEDQFSLLFVQRKVDAYNNYIAQKRKETAGASSVITASNQPAYTDERGNRIAFNYNAQNQARYADAVSQLQQIDPNYKFPKDPKQFTLQDKIQRALQYRAAGMEDELDPQNRLDALTPGKVGNVVSQEAAYLNRTGGVVSFDQLPKVTAKNYKEVAKLMQDNLRKLGETEWANDASIVRAKDVYKETKNQIIKQYNKSDNTAVYKIKAELENKFIKNKGGEIQTDAITIDFNFNSPYVDSKKKKSSGFKQGITEMANIVNYALYDNGEVRYSYGGLRSGDKGESLVPDKDDLVGQDIKLISQQIMADVQSSEQDIIKGRKGSVMLPQGKFTFSRKVFDADGNEYHAFNVQLNPNYLNQRKFKGTEENPGIASTHPELVSDGFTIYVPKKYTTKNSRMAIETERADVLSNTEVNLALDGKSENYFNGAGQLNLKEDKEKGLITLDGYYVNFVASKNAYDTIKIEPQIFQEDQFTDIDRAMDEQISILQNVFYTNEQIKKVLLEMKGVKDPAQLQQK